MTFSQKTAHSMSSFTAAGNVLLRFVNLTLPDVIENAMQNVRRITWVTTVKSISLDFPTRRLYRDPSLLQSEGKPNT